MHTVTSFATAARAAIEKQIPAARTAAALWHSGHGNIWAMWRREHGSFMAIGLRRHLDWVTGEAALAAREADPETLPLWIGERAPEGAEAGYRIRLGVLLHDEDRWWPAGETPGDLDERLEWIVLQLRVKAEMHFARHSFAR